MNRDRCKLGESLKIAGKLEEAIAHYRQASIENPQSPWACHDLAKVLQQSGQLEEALTYYQKAIALQPDFAPAYSPLRHLPLPKQSPLFDRLIAQYRHVIEIEPNFPLAYSNLAAVLTQIGKSEEAIAYFQKAVYLQTLAANPQLSQIQWQLGTPRHPDFLIVGSPRCGTTSLYKYLIAHPQILPAAEKEVQFFSQEFDRGLAWYLSHFMPPAADSIFLTGEATPTYLNHPQAAQRLYQCLPHTKLILILRNPVDRAISHYQMLVRRGTEPRTLETALQAELELLSSATEKSLEAGTYWKDCPYLDKSLYIYSIRRWLKFFPTENFLVLQSESFYANPGVALEQVFDFLGLPNYQLNQYPRYNAGTYQPANQSFYRNLTDYFQPHNQKLASDLGQSFSW